MVTENNFPKLKFPTFIIALVWICNGLFCKILNLVPRHLEIVSVFFGREYAREITLVIGFLEISMAFWVLSGLKSKWNTIAQIIIIGLMNILEFIFASELLLWGKMNILFASFFIIFLYYQEFTGLKNKQTC